VDINLIQLLDEGENGIQLVLHLRHVGFIELDAGKARDPAYSRLVDRHGFLGMTVMARL
jgi:hypothetical protein